MAAKVTQADIDALKGNAASLDKKQKEIQSKLNSLKNDKVPIIPNLSFTFCISDLTIFTLLYDKITNSQADNKKLWQKNKK